ncbi:hypothetical protein DVH24_042407 [Malus domestica]|uniref:SANT domain-containing protein n=1 Tax=Malus domestica TaxID=3750 RepID=A0A498IZ32_MALDO|nr:hypothetical protein DVH24_042407 [Malus domestica]
MCSVAIVVDFLSQWNLCSSLFQAQFDKASAIIEMSDWDDVFLAPAGVPARAGGRFRPKAKPRPSRVASTAAAPALPIVITEIPVTLSTTVSDSVPSVDVGDSKLTDQVGSIEPSENNEIPLSDGKKVTGPCESTADVAGSDGKASGENADIFSGLECLDDSISQTTRGTEFAVNKSGDKANTGTKPEAETGSDYCTTQDPMSCREVSVSNKQGEIEPECQVDGAFSDFEVLDVGSDVAISSERHAGKHQPKLKVKKGKENIHIPCSEVEPNMGSQAGHLVHFETGDMNESSLPAFPTRHVIDHPSPRLGDSSTLNPTPDSQVNTENLAETNHSDGAILGDAVHSEDVGGTPEKVGRKSRNRNTSTTSDLPQKRKSSAIEKAEGETSSRQLRKRVPHKQVDELADEANDDSFTAEPSSDSKINEDEDNIDEYREHETSQRKRAPRKSKKPVSEKEPVRKRKKTKEASDQSTKDASKKFSHSTRRNRRQVDKSLLEIPEEEFDPYKLSLKDLIRLAEHKELLKIKEARKLTTRQPNESTNSDSHKEGSHNEEFYPSEHGTDENQATYHVNSSLLNYQTYMDKAPTARWSKQDTELFYEAIQQCGSDFTMIQELYFPGRTRHQVKLKFKKEERQHPLRISEAVLSRSTHSTDHSQFTSYIEKLQQAAQANKESNADESVDMTSKEEGLREQTRDTDERMEKPESEEVQDQEADVAEVQDQEAVAAEVSNPLKSDEIDEEDFTWSD